MKDLAIRFVKEHAAADEQVCLANCDADDVYRRGLFNEIELYCKLKEIYDTTLITCPSGYRFLLHEKKCFFWEAACRSMNNFVITRDRNVSSFDVAHHLMKDYYEKKNRKVYVCNEISKGWIKTETPDNVDNLYTARKYENILEKAGRVGG